MAVTATMYMIVLPLCFVAALIDAIGGGGGLISLPAYMVAGLPTALASGSNKLSASFGTLIAAVKFLRSKKVLLVPALCAVAGAIPGAYLGAELLSRTPEHIMRLVILGVIPVMALVMILKRNAPEREHLTLTRGKYVLCFLTGLLIGLYDGFCGPGTGTLLIMGFTWIVGMDTVTASGSAKIVNLASNISALLSHALNGNILFALAVPAMLCAAAGGYIGSALAIKKGAKFVRIVMMCMMVVLVVKLFIDYL